MQFVCRERLSIDGSLLGLNFASSPSSSKSRLRLRLSEGARPPALRSVSVSAAVEGRRLVEAGEQQLLEAEDDLEWTVEWDGRDAYGQRVTGGAEVTVEVGYRSGRGGGKFFSNDLRFFTKSIKCFFFFKICLSKMPCKFCN